MLCDNCGKNEANIKYTQIINGEKKELILCEECGEKLGVGNFNMPLDFTSFFGDFLDGDSDLDIIPTLTSSKQLTCDKCNMTFDDFIKIGKFGCDNCYNVFSEKIDPILKRLHGNNRYIGRKAKITDIPYKFEEGKIEENNEVDKLKENLKKAIAEEKYEEAAKIRDKIKKIENK